MEKGCRKLGSELTDSLTPSHSAFLGLRVKSLFGPAQKRSCRNIQIALKMIGQRAGILSRNGLFDGGDYREECFASYLSLTSANTVLNFSIRICPFRGRLFVIFIEIDNRGTV